MGLKDDIKNKSKEIEKTVFSQELTTSVPTLSNHKLTFGCTGLKFNATVLYIDMRGSTKVLNTHQKRVVAKIHMIYYHAIVKIAQNTGGEIRSFNGDSLLVFYPGNTRDTISNAVKAAMQMRYAITHIINETLQNYIDIDFGIGIDYGEILATKVGVGGSDETKDLIWIGNAVNRAAKISDKCKANYYIGISQSVYNHLNDNVKFGERDGFWGKEKVDMWTSCFFTYNDNLETIYKTDYYWQIN